MLLDPNAVIMENQHHLAETRRELAEIRLAQLSRTQATPATVPAPQKITRFRRYAGALAAIFALR